MHHPLIKDWEVKRKKKENSKEKNRENVNMHVRRKQNDFSKTEILKVQPRTR